MLQSGLIFLAALYMAFFAARMLYIARTRGYVVARTYQFDPRETKQHRSRNPSKFWANVACGVVMLPLGLVMMAWAGGDFMQAMRDRSILMAN